MFYAEHAKQHIILIAGAVGVILCEDGDVVCIDDFSMLTAVCGLYFEKMNYRM